MRASKARTLEVEGKKVSREVHLAGDVGVEKERFSDLNVCVANGFVHYP